MKTIVIDPGHGGNDPGAIASLDGVEYQEKNIVLAVSLILTKLLEPYNCTVILTRAKDEFLTLSERARISNRAQADAFLSIHCNAFSKESANGFEGYTSPGETRADKYATLTLMAWKEQFPKQTPRFDWSDGDPDKEARFTVLVATKAPALLFEMGFITNPDELRLMMTTEWKHLAAEALLNGLIGFLSLRKREDVALSEPVEDIPTRPPSIEERLSALERRCSP